MHAFSLVRWRKAASSQSKAAQRTAGAAVRIAPALPRPGSRKATNVSCTHCVRAKAKCGQQRPCPRCIRLHQEATCVNRDCTVKAPRARISSDKPAPRTAFACSSCRVAKSRCDDGHPCGRCYRLGRSITCRVPKAEPQPPEANSSSSSSSSSTVVPPQFDVTLDEITAATALIEMAIRRP
ncbi:Zn(2)-C6 fungal-type domain-containing protein [Plasmodiophora brassicae]|uniref:Zn(2)-C6 fungal-type domain-containing protein n=1 Tax=Plasmodiophora brassicae TaxID=37360 RepID=A0A0G4J5D9_PLABS|nr:hypothetical protein PBRA_009100 [Plasmodiophora brassicae]